MRDFTKAEILDILRMPDDEFLSSVLPEAKAAYRAQGDRLYVSAMLGYSNICKNQCLYCGMRAGNAGLPRYRIAPKEALAALESARALGLERIFLISGEDPKYPWEDLLALVSGARALGYRISLAAGELDEGRYRTLRLAGLDEYVLKFEMSDPAVFNRLNPSTTFDRRMNCIRTIGRLGFRLASGNIIDYPGHTLEHLADDLLLMKALDISWAPVIPYMPVKGTPLAQEGGPGSIGLLLREIAILRLMMPEIRITAQQPGRDLSRGLSDEQANLDALNAGANLLFVDLLDEARSKHFSVVDNRTVLGLEHARKMARLSGMALAF